MSFSFINLLYATLFFAAFAVVVATPAFAQEATSSSFMTQNSTINTLGGSASSTSFSDVLSADQVAGGQSTSTNFMINAGFEYFTSSSFKQQNWRWYDDETHETPTVPLSGENVAPASISNFDVVKLRVSVAETSGVNASNAKFSLQFATSSDFSSTIGTVAEITSCTASSSWCYADGGGVDNGVITTKLLSDADACSGSVGTGCGIHNESGTSASSYTQVGSSTAEYEFTIEESGAVQSTVYFFRLFDNANGTVVPLNSGKSYPSLSSQSGSLTFSIGGVASSTVTSGITTNIDTTSTSVPFGTLLASSSAAGAQQLTVTTNAGQGYSIFSFSAQGLLGSGADEIAPITGSNQSPVSWAFGCAATSTGCYGYHTGSSVLSGGSARFAPDDTYAPFVSTPSEVDYSAGATTSKSTNIVYKLQVHNTQQAGSYSTSITYIVVPVF